MDFPKSVPGVGLVGGVFVDEDPATARPGSLIPAVWGNSVTAEILSVITGAGLTPDENNVSQLVQAIQTLVQAQAGLFGVDTGVANNYVVVYSPAITSLKNGVMLRFKAKIANSGDSTLVVNGLPSRQIVGLGKVALQGGEITSDGMCLVIFSTALDKWVLCNCSGGALQISPGTKSSHAVQLGQIVQATTSQSGMVKISTDAKIAEGTDNEAAITALGLKNRSQSTSLDATPGRLLTPGAFGLGGVSPAFPGNDLNTTVNYNGTFGTSTGCLNAPAGWNVQGSIVKHAVWLSAGAAQQTFEEHITGRTARRALNAGIWGEWAEVVQGISGAVMFFAMSTAPASWLVCNGSAVSRAAYATLFSKIGVLYGAGDGSTTFNIPDMRGEFPRGLDLGRGVDIGRGIGSAQAGDIQSHTHGLQYGSNVGTNFGSPGYNSVNTITSAGVQATGGAETRPRNIALLPCIKI